MKQLLLSLSICVISTLSAQTELDLINSVSLDSLSQTVQEFTGEIATNVGGNSVTILNRGQANNDLAGDFLVDKFNAMDNLTVNDQAFNTNGRNIIATQLGKTNPNDIYIICAHYDSVADYCADDNASGTATVLEIARILSTQCMDNTIIYALWDEEEIGLRGASFYATQANTNGDNILGVLNIDMMGYDGDNDDDFDIDVRPIANSLAMKDDLVGLLATYGFNLNVNVVNPGTPASDHARFWDQGFSAVLVGESWENNDQTPHYHSSGDRYSTLDLPYFHEIAKLIMSYMVTKGSLVSVDNSLTMSSTTLTSNMGNASYRWFDCSTNLPLTSEVSQSFSPTASGSYAVEVTVGSCTELSSCVDFTSLDADTFKLNMIKIYSNPTSSILHIEHSLNDDLAFELFSIEGKKVLETILTEKRTKVNMSQFTLGAYFVRITQDKKVFSQKIVIGK
ncbi:peptidase, M28 family [Formosa sp. Hel1_33_131]|uniref:M28 family peptidase n=1 Tax=Formosa sp. Hel1_33_131 TaxID=1336794 RepID=UPI00084E0DD6|nr:M28 family peptidase [Formosa sp. Hel1_33_131]AOR27945.1 peptidase, M28 family [Formosa sp. Hel1_33_131]